LGGIKMIIYKRCTEVEKKLIFQGFSVGFSDYIIKMNITEEEFFQRFFGPEGNSLQNSFIAKDGNDAIGVILGGVKEFEGIKTIRCGALAVSPAYRGMGVSKELFALHKEEAIKTNCKQMFLEVIEGNHRAISFYKKLGYEKIYNLSYFSLKNINLLKESKCEDLNIREIDMEMLRTIEEYTKNIHINWQNHMDYLERLDGQKHFGAFINRKLVGAISGSANGKINFIYVRPEFRGGRIGLNLLNEMVENLNLTKISMSYPNNASLEGFLKRLGFERESISQYEMYLTM
jgi:ribosomal protein S18 acetylase RimI-like enzyme